MKGFDHLHPALQYHIVNSLGWRELRPFQDLVIPKVVAGDHLIILAPTAGGKTESAFFPALSRMLTENWSGLSVLYVCPIKALLNNLDHRLSRYCELLGRRSGLWHGDVGQTARKRLLRNPPDCLLTTPESLEVMLISKSVDEERLFSGLRMIIVDEVHAFAGDDRGWHLLSVLERIQKLAGREVQRIGLSATVGNPDLLLQWLAGNCKNPKGVALPPPSAQAPADVHVDFVGSLSNAAKVISQVHRGEKRLVFLDSRSGTEELGLLLRNLGIKTFVTHSSLSQEERHRTEAAFAQESDCVIVATSVLELGIDVGDLDRVIQIDGPASVAGFLQRMGRTGRRSGTIRNCLMLGLKPQKLLQEVALVELWEQGFVEPILPPPEPYHILSQQLMALALQQGGIGRSQWFEWVKDVYGYSQFPTESVAEMESWMVEKDILSNDEGLLWLGAQGESTFGRKNFMELFSVFTSPPIFHVLHGRSEIGQVDESALLIKQDGPRLLSLGGRSWEVQHVDWQRKHAYVQPSELLTRTKWPGAGIGLSFRICQMMREILCSTKVSERWSERCKTQLENLRTDFHWLCPDGLTMINEDHDRLALWTFAGARANSIVAYYLAQEIKSQVISDGFKMKFDGDIRDGEIRSGLQRLSERGVLELTPIPADNAIRGLKFSECLPPRLAGLVGSARLRDDEAVDYILRSTIHSVVTSDPERVGKSLGSRRTDRSNPMGSTPPDSSET